MWELQFSLTWWWCDLPWLWYVTLLELAAPTRSLSAASSRRGRLEGGEEWSPWSPWWWWWWWRAEAWNVFSMKPIYLLEMEVFFCASGSFSGGDALVFAK